MGQLFELNRLLLMNEFQKMVQEFVQAKYRILYLELVIWG